MPDHSSDSEDQGSVAETNEVKLWQKRREAAKDLKEVWEQKYRTQACYQYWTGNQRAKSTDKFGHRKMQVNLIHADVAEDLPSLYFFRPFARITPQPEMNDTPGTELEAQTLLLQDTVNHLIRIPTTRFDPSTRLATKEAKWALGVVECGYEADFIDAPDADRPSLREEKDTRGAEPPMLRRENDDSLAIAEEPLELNEEQKLELELQDLKQGLKGETFYVKHIPAKQFMISQSDKPILEDNDWIGYWEDVPLEDVKRSPAYFEAAKNLKSIPPGDDEEARRQAIKVHEDSGIPKPVRLYKIWDLRNMVKLVFAEGHPVRLFSKAFKRVPLKVLRFDIDPYHFYPLPPLTHKLDSQDEYNHSREYLRTVRNGTVPRYTYDQDAIDAEQMRKLERGDMGAFIPRAGGTPGQDVIAPVSQPSLSENALQTLTLSKAEMAEVGASGGDAKISASKTATQAKIAESKNQAQDSFARVTVATFLADVSKELLMLAIDNMLMDKWVAVNVAPDSLYADQAAEEVRQQYQMVTGAQLRSADSGIEWDLDVDMEQLSPVSKEERFHKWMQGLSFIGNPGMAMVFSAAPELLEETLDLMGMRSAKKKQLITEGLGKVVQMQQQMAQAQGQGSAPSQPGVSPQPNQQNPGSPSDGGPQPGGPPGPGASNQ